LPPGTLQAITGIAALGGNALADSETLQRTPTKRAASPTRRLFHIPPHLLNPPKASVEKESRRRKPRLQIPVGSLSSTVLPEAHTASASPQYKPEQVKVSLSY